jgi:hypothetical protein
MLGKLQDTSSLSNSIHRATDLTKMTTFNDISLVNQKPRSTKRTWLNSRVSRSSFSFLFFWISSSLT